MIDCHFEVANIDNKHYTIPVYFFLKSVSGIFLLNLDILTEESLNKMPESH